MALLIIHSSPKPINYPIQNYMSNYNHHFFFTDSIVLAILSNSKAYCACMCVFSAETNKTC